ncbi:aspartyl-tRNA synthetase [Candidatus Arthromitus sp. SFB-mouse-Japan]|uniref:aspartate--tRNA ligase n=1 Tax=unclassified Candidatus Neoarthromitus TaxID=2638829 RepID=UPI00021B7D50|nr:MULTISPECIES: aspartate--tRNA ligase [unclassified Candidatus Arthromitus]EIA24472.1 Aspartyl-tRNA synthetase [Candidatus Arthromitus sp. SFB-1]EIA27603.1 Aspartyl-tRNA synthetase [Candidatus Arthromitus sp. SFB-4]EIA27754.1 Aspartyl-tRNA synthetase [Candidatus Arthromitus sp. SFB-co]EIA30895.1 Aspartyl-tRNA synthetase [Candidatus Arthromitus sp. SFB-mouse-SU]AID44835.1 Aspartyl-tRNA synthetase [Candidatus Arthromitus sp. SFB-mouse-NL]
MKFEKLHRTEYCGLIDKQYLNQRVILEGWVNRKRNLGSLIFVDLRDREGIVQIVFKEGSPIFDIGDSLKSEYCIKVGGIVKERESKNTQIKNGDIEVICDNIEVYSKSEQLPFMIEDGFDVNDSLKFKYRYISLRNNKYQEIFKLRSEALNAFREFLHNDGFIEMSTPILNKSTPEGARDFLVPSRINNGNFYALPQSPQIYKQLLMVSGFDKYYQVATCFRDEDLRSNRQPEFIQIDIEMSFVDETDIKNKMELLIKHVFNSTLNLNIVDKFIELGYDECMEKYGTDKPDLRFDMEIIDVKHDFINSEFLMFKECIENNLEIRAIKAENVDFTRKQLDTLNCFVKDHFNAKGLIYIRYKEDQVISSINKFLSDEDKIKIVGKYKLKNNDCLFIIPGVKKTVLGALGALRIELANMLGILNNNTEFKFLWVKDFPLYEYSEEDGRYYASHHPFTMPNEDDIKYFDTKEYSKIRAKAYDLVLNGEEIGGGSIRIHNDLVQNKMFEALGMSDCEINEKFGFFVEALKYGTPPHGGIAFGLDRIVMFLANVIDIKDVMAFPKNKKAECLLSNAPSRVGDIQLHELGIYIKE